MHFATCSLCFAIVVACASIASAQNIAPGIVVPNAVQPGQLPPGMTPGALQQAQQQAMQQAQQAQQNGGITAAQAMQMRMLQGIYGGRNGYHNPPRTPNFGAMQAAQQAAIQQQAAIEAAEAAKKAERREKIKQSIIARKQKDEAAKAAKDNK